MMKDPEGPKYTICFPGWGSLGTIDAADFYELR